MSWRAPRNALAWNANATTTPCKTTTHTLASFPRASGRAWPATNVTKRTLPPRKDHGRRPRWISREQNRLVKPNPRARFTTEARSHEEKQETGIWYSVVG